MAVGIAIDGTLNATHDRRPVSGLAPTEAAAGLSWTARTLRPDGRGEAQGHRMPAVLNAVPKAPPLLHFGE